MFFKCFFIKVKKTCFYVFLFENQCFYHLCFKPHNNRYLFNAEVALLLGHSVRLIDGHAYTLHNLYS